MLQLTFELPWVNVNQLSNNLALDNVGEFA